MPAAYSTIGTASHPGCHNPTVRSGKQNLARAFQLAEGGHYVIAIAKLNRQLKHRETRIRSIDTKLAEANAGITQTSSQFGLVASKNGDDGDIPYRHLPV